MAARAPREPRDNIMGRAVLSSLDCVSHCRAERDSDGDPDRNVIDRHAQEGTEAHSECDSKCHDGNKLSDQCGDDWGGEG
ncbi:hypothetical protein PPNSA23_26070 [Phyllobacterium phragmitis]|uniref:Uncharacterized protein n=1 Tax=Phyllobacterium phragmitis TaxID=2670329 RepID=A0ABQ0H169_9HYPH